MSRCGAQKFAKSDNFSCQENLLYTQRGSYLRFQKARLRRERPAGTRMYILSLSLAVRKRELECLRGDLCTHAHEVAARAPRIAPIAAHLLRVPLQRAEDTGDEAADLSYLFG